MQNFGEIKNIFNTILIESIISKNSKNREVFKKYYKMLKEDSTLKTQFLVYNNLENKCESNENKAIGFVKENIEILKELGIPNINESNNKLIKLLGKTIGVDQFISPLYESINKLVSTKKSPENIDSILEAQDFIVKHILNNKPKEISESLGLPNSMVSSIMIDKYNERYSTLDESSKKILKVLISSTDEEKLIVYKDTLRECLDLVNEKLIEADIDTKDKLLKVKEKLLNNKQEINEEFFSNISKLVELKNNLTDK